MYKIKERRKEKRLRYQLPIQFSEDFTKTAFHGVMADISTRAMAFNCVADENCPRLGQHLTTRFSLPRSGKDCSDMIDLIRTGCVCRVDKISNSQCRVAIQFDEPPPFWNTHPTVK